MRFYACGGHAAAILNFSKVATPPDVYPDFFVLPDHLVMEIEVKISAIRMHTNDPQAIDYLLNAGHLEFQCQN